MKETNMNNWRKVKLGDAIEIIGGGTPKRSCDEYWNGDIPWLSVIDFNNNKRYVYDSSEHITKKGLKESSTKLLKKGQIIISARGTVGALAQISRPMAFNQSCYGITSKDNYCINDFLYFLIKNSVSEIKRNTHGSIFDTITKDTFNIIEVMLPPLDEQKRITNILSSFDDKIELNNRINKNLEEQAQALFRHWFVDFEFPNEQGLPYKSNGGKFVKSEHGAIPEGWISGKFTDIVNIQGGGTPQTKNRKFWNGYIPFFTPKDVSNVCFTLFTEKQITEEGLKNCNSEFYPKYTVFITARGTVGKIVIAGQNMAMNQSCYALVGKDDNIQYFVYYYTKELIYLLRNKASGAVFDAITTRDFDSDNVVIPPKGIIKKFQNNIEPLMALILNNCKENQGLVQLRDTILPRLMNNQIKI